MGNLGKAFIIGGFSSFLSLSAFGQSLDEGIAARDRGDYEAALQNWRPLAEQGDALAQFNMGNMYGHGLGVEPDASTAFYWFHQAAEQGHVEAQSYVGGFYLAGIGVPQDYDEALYWLHQAAEQGDTLAYSNLGRAHFSGLGVPQNYSEAFDWLHKAAEQGDVDVYEMNMMGFMYAEGLGIPQDYSKSIPWFRQAAEQGHAEAQHNLGVAYYKGRGLTSNRVMAYVMANLAAAQGHQNAAILRTRYLSELSQAQINEGQRIASEWRVGTPLPH